STPWPCAGLTSRARPRTWPRRIGGTSNFTWRKVLPDRTNDIRLVVLDWAGTTVDFGCFAPVAPFVGAFAREGITVTSEQARGPRRLHKKDHIRTLLQLPDITNRWQQLHGRSWTDSDVERLFREHFIPLQMQAVRQHVGLVPGLLACVEQLRSRGIKIATTTG